MNLKTESYELIFTTSRVFGQYEDETHAADLKVAQSIKILYAEHKILSGEFSAKIYIDWNSLVKYYEKLVDRYESSQEKRVQEHVWRPVHNYITCPVKIEISQSAEGSRFSSEKEIIILVLTEIFLIANLSTPGSLNLYSAKLKSSFGGATENDEFISLRLSDFLYDSAWINSKKSPMELSFIDFTDVYNWYQSLEIGLKQVAKRRIERTLFILQNIAADATIAPSSTLWLAAAIESIYSANGATPASVLMSRIIKYLQISIRDEKKFRRDIRKFYEIRNKYIHGAGPISHPLGMERWDLDADKTLNEIMAVNATAALVILKTLQNLITANARELAFDETIRPIPSVES